MPVLGNEKLLWVLCGEETDLIHAASRSYPRKTGNGEGAASGTASTSFLATKTCPVTEKQICGVRLRTRIQQTKGRRMVNGASKSSPQTQTPLF